MDGVVHVRRSWRTRIRLAHLVPALALVAIVLTGCGGKAAGSADQASGGVPAPTVQPYTSAVLVTTYENAMPASSQLALGTFRLEGTKDAVTAGQAKALLPLWQALQSGALKNDAETNAVLKQIEGTMTPQQLVAVAAMKLTREDLRSWMQEQGLSLGPPPGATGAPGGFGNMTEGQRASFRATAEAGGFGSGGPPQNLSDEERASFRATAEAGGASFPGRPSGARGGQVAFLAEPLVKLLTARAAE